jgi:Uma2 family endonuclease
MSALPTTALTFEQYLEIEREAEFRSEFIKGEIVAMSGGTENHNLITVRTTSLLDQQLGDGPCRAFSNDMRVYSEAEDVSAFPDIFVTCGPRRYYRNRRDTLTDAAVVIEVLSPSTKRYDMSEKFEYYRTLPSFREYLMLWQDRVRAEHHVRQSDGSWKMLELNGLESVIELPSIGCRLPLKSVYARVEFENS